MNRQTFPQNPRNRGKSNRATDHHTGLAQGHVPLKTDDMVDAACTISCHMFGLPSEFRRGGVDGETTVEQPLKFSVVPNLLKIALSPAPHSICTVDYSLLSIIIRYKQHIGPSVRWGIFKK